MGSCRYVLLSHLVFFEMQILPFASPFVHRLILRALTGGDVNNLGAGFTQLVQMKCVGPSLTHASQTKQSSGETGPTNLNMYV